MYFLARLSHLKHLILHLKNTPSYLLQSTCDDIAKI